MTDFAEGIKGLATGSRRRLVDGIVVTLREQRTKQTWVRHLAGANFIELIRDLAREIDALEPAQTWRICSISTPDSIYRDLQGARGILQREKTDSRSGRVQRQPIAFDPLDMERKTMARIGRAELVEKLAHPTYLQPRGAA